MSEIYTIPEIYDIAFDFRDVPAEVDFLLEQTKIHLGRNAEATMELACGPAYHVREMAKRKLIAHGLDLEPKMAEYTRGLIAQEQLTAQIIEGDMRSYKTEQKYDLVYILMASFAQLLTNQDILDNFDCVADLLTDGGVYIISTAHPRDFFAEEQPSTQLTWTMKRGYVTVDTCWGGTQQEFDPLTEIDDIVVSFKVTTPVDVKEYEFPERMRRCSIKTFEALIALSGRFEIVDLYGTLDTGLKLSNDSKCWRFIPILKKLK